MRVPGVGYELCDPDFIAEEIRIVIEFHKSTIGVPAIHDE